MEDKKINLDQDTKYVLDIINANNERQIRRLWILIAVLIFLIAVTNIGWIVYESRYEDVAITQTVSQDSGQGGSNHIEKLGDYFGGDYGETDGNTNN